MTSNFGNLTPEQKKTWSADIFKAAVDAGYFDGFGNRRPRTRREKILDAWFEARYRIQRAWDVLRYGGY